MHEQSLVEFEISNVKRELEIVSLLLKKRRRKALDEIEIRGAALSLAAVYNGMEKILSHMLTHQGQSIEQTASWHTALLEKAETNGIISEETTKELKGFLAFRHFVRHAYSFEINPTTIEKILETAPGLVTRFIDEIGRA